MHFYAVFMQQMPNGLLIWMINIVFMHFYAVFMQCLRSI